MKVTNMFYEMANAAKSDTGLPYTLWIDSKGSERKTKHNSPRVKIEVNGEFIPISISKEPKILKRNTKEESIPKFSKVKNFIIDHYDTLIKHWNKEISDREALNLLVKKEKKK